MDFTKKVYSFNDIPEKKKYVLDRLKKIYVDINQKKLETILDSIKIVFRKQDEKGASNHLKKIIYVSLNEIDKYDIKNEKDFLEYLNDPKSVVTHETTHLFQNHFEVFPDVKYTYQDETGERKIDYEKYVTDNGEIQSRLEQVVELLEWGFEKEEIVNFLYNRQEKDKDLWRKMVDSAIELQKRSSSKMPGIDENEDVTNDLGRFTENYKTKTKDKNYEKSYL
jgi:hypothetical protein